jgi:5-(carboxyamino)imidazole ribonucleotide synthase
MVMGDSQVKRVGVIGGGQLAWMMAAGAKKLGVELLVQTPNADDPACAIATRTFLGPITNAQLTAEMAQHCDVITFENEFVDLPALRELEAQGIQFYPQLDCLAPLLDKYDQRQYCERLNLPSPTFVTLQGVEDLPTLPEQVAAVGLPLALKTRRHGYDGQGTFILHSLEAVEATWQRLNYQPVLLEAFVAFEKELAVMVARGQAGDVAVYPVVETQQIDQVCRRVIAPAQVSAAVADEVKAIATQFVTHLCGQGGGVGIFGIELFLAANGQVMINEIAPRTHNSGHYTLDACETSQFEQQLRAVCGLPLGSTALIPRAGSGSSEWANSDKSGAVMINLLGTDNDPNEEQQRLSAIAQLPQAKLYWYGKSASRVGRKMGHVTILTPSGDRAADDTAQGNATEVIQQVEKLWY